MKSNVIVFIFEEQCYSFYLKSNLIGLHLIRFLLPSEIFILQNTIKNILRHHKFKLGICQLVLSFVFISTQRHKVKDFGIRWQSVFYRKLKWINMAVITSLLLVFIIVLMPESCRQVPSDHFSRLYNLQQHYQFVWWYFSVPWPKTVKNLLSLSFSVSTSINLSSHHMF